MKIKVLFFIVVVQLILISFAKSNILGLRLKREKNTNERIQRE